MFSTFLFYNKHRNPYDILEQRDINFNTTPRLVETLGFYVIVNNRRFIRLSAYASKIEQFMAAGHELGHDFFDRDEVRANGPLKDTWFYSLSTTRQERRANLFSAELMIPDEAVLEPIGYYDYEELLEKERKRHPHASDREIQEYSTLEFQTRYGDTCSTKDIAHEQGVDPVLIEFKYKALLEKGFELPISPELRNDYFVNKVTHFGIDALRSDLLERARKMTRVRGENHPWRSMSDEELLRSAGLILTDDFTQREGITLAAILLFGKDSTIMSVLPQHKTDAIFRVQNIDRYDDRDVVITNLIESYDRLFSFGEKHLNDTFHLEGIQSVSARNHILREIVSNLLMHRDFSSGYVAKLVIEKDRLYTENANLSHGYGSLNLATFDPFQKNPPISRVFREIGLADELGSGMRNTYKYTRMYSGEDPEFIEGDVFRIIVPLPEIATATVGPTSSSNAEVSTEVSTEVTTEVEVKLSSDKLHTLLDYCSTPRTRAEMQLFCEIKTEKYFREKILQPMLASGMIKRTIPDKPRSSKQKYIKARVISQT